MTSSLIAGRYTPVREIGRGGMGAVWLARDETLGRDVAVKRVGMVPGGGTPDLERAAREARLAARLNHPHVVAVFDLVHEDDHQYLVMEYVDGATLADLVREHGALTPDAAAPMLEQAADALAAAHAAGIVHRDVKPSNMLVTRDGQVKLSDFGIARAEADASLTQTGLVTGSPAYLAPEVASGAHATDASDVWSLGATLYHALAGEPPYQVGDNLMGALYRIVHEDPPRLANAGWLGPLLTATMTKEPSARWSMAQVRDFLSAPRQETRRAAAPSPQPDAHRTEVLPAVAPAPVPAPTPEPEPVAAPAEPPRRRGLSRVAVVAAVLLALLVAGVVWGALALRDDPTTGANSPDSPDSSDSTSRSPKPSDPTTTQETPEQPTRVGMETFVSDYLTTAASDPETAYESMLTPGFQADSGGLDGYLGFWDTVETADLVSVSADPGSLTVDYQVSYTLNGGSPRPPESVSLTLEFQDGTYRIAAEA